MKLNNKLIERMPVITASGVETPTVNIASDYGDTKLVLYLRNGYNYTDYFKVSDNSIKIKSDNVKKVLVSGQCLCSRGPNGYVSLYIRKNNETLAYARHQWVDWYGESLVTAPIVVDVSKNDTFELYFGSSKAGNYIFSYGSKATVLTIQAIEIE